jgi:hypothetical protein
MRVERIVLEHHRDVALFGRNHVDDTVVNADFTGGDRFQPRDHAQERRFSAAGWTDENNEFTVVDTNIYTVDDFDRAK